MHRVKFKFTNKFCLRVLVRRRQAVILRFMNAYNYLTKSVSGLFIAFMFMAATCLSAQELSPQPETEKQSNTVNAAAAERGGISDLSASDSEVMRHVFTAEVAVAKGDLSAAAAEYLEAALASDDPRIAERATKVAVSAGDWQMVTLASDQWAMLEPKSLDARRLAAGSRLRVGDYVGAEYQFTQMLELADHDEGQLWTVVIAMLAPVPDQGRANKILDNLFKNFDVTQNPDALFAHSQFAARQGDLSKAAALIVKAIELEPERVDLLTWAGRLAVNGKDEDLALQYYKRAWEINRGDVPVAMAYAELLKRRGDVQQAQEILVQLPDTPDMRFARIVLSLDVGDKPNAELIYQGFAAADYTNASAGAFNAGQSAELLEFPREAIGWYKLVTGERATIAILRQAFLLAELGDVEAARDLLAQARTRADLDFGSQDYQAEVQILQDADRTDEAMQVLNEALADLPEDVPLRYTRALIAVGLGSLDQAEKDLKIIISAQPGNAAALNALGYTLADLTDRFEEAEQLILQAYRLQPQETSIVDSMGWVAYRLGRLQEAEKFLREAWSNARNAEIAAHLGEVLWVSGQKDEAREVWQLGFKVDSDNEILLETVQRLGDKP